MKKMTLFRLALYNKGAKLSQNFRELKKPLMTNLMYEEVQCRTAKQVDHRFLETCLRGEKALILKFSGKNDHKFMFYIKKRIIF